MTTSPLDSPPTAPLLRLDLGLLPAADRFPFWHDEGSRILRPLATDPPTPPAVTCDVLQLGPVTLAQMEASP